MSLTWYRFRATLRQRLPGYISIVALTALLGGLAMGSLAAARRTSSSYSTFLAKTHPSDLALGTALVNPTLGYLSGYDPNLVHTIARLPHVQRVESYAGVAVLPLGPDNAPTAAALNANFTPLGSLDGEYFDQDRATAVQGRLPDPTRADEFAITAQLAHELGLRVGQAVRLGVYTAAQSASPQFGTAAVAPHASLTARLVGVLVFNHAVVQDDVDAASGQYMLFTPAFTAPVATCCTYFTFSDLRLQRGTGDVSAVEAGIQRVFPKGLPFDPRATSVVRAKTQRAIQPAAVALVVFGAIVALAGLVVVGQVIDRQLRAGAGDSEVLRALGAGQVMTATARLAGLLGAAVLGAALAVAAAVALSPLAPLGPVRPVYPHRGPSADWIVLGGGLAVLVAALAVVLAWRQAPHRVAGASSHRARLPRAARPLPVAADTGLRFGVGTGDRRSTVGVRSAILGTALAVTVVTGAVTFGSSLSTLISHPALYGWGWDYALDGGGGAGAVPGAASSRMLGASPDVAAWSPVYFANLQIDGQTVPVLGADPRAAVAPPVLSGHGLEATDQIVLGATTLASLHKHVGDSVDVRYGVATRTPLRIVGTASLPALGTGGVEVTHLSMSTGALLAYGLIPESVRNSFGNFPPGPNAILVRVRHGVPRGARSRR